MSGAEGATADFVPKRSGDVEWVELDGEVVLHDWAAAMLHRLNVSAAAVWFAADGSASVTRIVERLGESYAGHRETIERDVRAIIRRLCRLGLLESPDEAVDGGG